MKNQVTKVPLVMKNKIKDSSFTMTVDVLVYDNQIEILTPININYDIEIKNIEIELSQ